MRMTDEELIACARAARDKAYAPYSRYQVGAALLGADGVVYTGCNVESAAFGAGLCAERGAVAQAVAAGCRHFTKAAVIASGKGICTPCGICRQLLAEFGADLEILCCRSDGSYVRHTLQTLLPFSFDVGAME
ncbi:MAG: cytidine deaminase [Oscillospiraceae bacterium]|nr:cytidine deaminase [Oscillospiraceae bacterium]